MAKKKKGRTPDEIFKAKIKLLTEGERSMNAAVIEFQKKLFELLSTEFVPLLKVVDGFVADTPANAALISRIDTYFDKLETVLQKDVLSPFVNTLLQSASLTGEYYVALGFKKSVVDELLKNKVRVEERIGITPKGRLRKDGYLYKLGKTQQAREELKTFMVNSLTGDTSFLDLQLGFRNLVIGTKTKAPVATVGRLQKYFDQFAYDKFNEVDSIANNQIAANLNLVHFVYEGSIIDNTRAFCEKRAGKVFHVEETKTWKDDPTLIDKATKDTYKPLIERGRFRCRHFIKYITKTVYVSLGGTYKIAA